MNEVGCRATAMLLELLEREGFAVAECVRGLPVSESYLRDRHRRVDWEVWVELVERAQRVCGGVEGLRRLGVAASEGPELHEFKRVARLIASPRQLYKLNARWAVTADFRNFRATCSDLPNGRLRVTFKIDPHHRGSSAAFELATGILKGIPKLLDQPEAEILASVTSHGGTWDITPPPSRTIWKRALRAFDALLGAETAIAQLGEQQQEIVAQYRIVEEQLREQRAIEAALRRSEGRWRSLVQNAPGFIFVIDAAGAVRSVNRAFGDATPEAIAGRSFFDLAAPECHPGVRAAFEHALKTGSAMDFEFQPAGRSPTPWYAGRVGTLEEEGPSRSLIVLLTDVSDRKRAEAALRASEEQLRQGQRMEAIGRLAGGVAHDFNNLLTVVLSYTSLLEERVAPDPFVSEALQEITRAGTRAVDLTRQLLAFSRQQVLRPTRLDLNQIVGEVEKMLKRLIGEDIELVERLEPSLGHVKLDRGQIEQVVVNLVVNARDAMPQGGTLTIETADAQLDQAYAEGQEIIPGRYVMLVVSDTGAGMDRATQARIFEPFFTTKKTGEGTGLGLATVRGIVQQSGGSIRVYSEPGVGTTFRIYFPRSDEPDRISDKPEISVTSLTGTETVLLVEDDEQLRMLAHKVLVSRGYSVLEAGSAREALDLSGKFASPIHLLLTDVIMPEMNGRDLARALESERPGLSVLYMSGYAEHIIVSRGVIAEGVVLLQKPFTPDLLALRVRQALEAGATTASGASVANAP